MLFKVVLSEKLRYTGFHTGLNRETYIFKENNESIYLDKYYFCKSPIPNIDPRMMDIYRPGFPTIWHKVTLSHYGYENLLDPNFVILKHLNHGIHGMYYYTPSKEDAVLLKLKL